MINDQTALQTISERRIAWASALLFPTLSVLSFVILHAWWAFIFTPLLFLPILFVWKGSATNRTIQYRTAIMAGVTTILLLITVVNLIAIRAKTVPTKDIHDGAVQTEDAITFFLHGVNPYSADYRSMPFGGFYDGFSRGVRPNPAWWHHVYLPFHFLVSLPFSYILNHLTGWYDQRVVYIFSEIVALFFVIRLARGREWQLLIGVLFALNPFWVKFFVQGYNDIFVFSLMAGMLWNLRRGRWNWAGLMYGLACASKQSAWMFAPFLIAYLFWKGRSTKRDWRIPLLLALGIGALFIAPFFFWNPKDFIDDIYRYPAGSLTTSYPISGFGISDLMVSSGIIKSIWDYYPFIYIQLLLAGPLLAVLLLFQRTKNTLSQLVVFSLVFSFVFWFLSRFFNWNYISYLTFFAIAAIALAGPPQFFTHRAHAE